MPRLHADIHLVEGKQAKLIAIVPLSKRVAESPVSPAVIRAKACFNLRRGLPDPSRRFPLRVHGHLYTLVYRIGGRFLGI